MSVLARKSIPLIASGMFLFSTGFSEDLAHQLFREGRWMACQRECRRIKIEQGENTPARIGKLYLFCSERMNPKKEKERIQYHHLTGKPARWIVSLYRNQISSAIGQRCTLEPSCSEYFRQASNRHGILGIPIIADRFVREPTVNSEKEKPVFVNSLLRYRDSLDEHDFWMTP